MKRDPSYASTAEDIAALVIWEMVTSTMLFVGMGESFDMKNRRLPGFLLLILRGRRCRYGLIKPCMKRGTLLLRRGESWHSQEIVLQVSWCFLLERHVGLRAISVHVALSHQWCGRSIENYRLLLG